MSKVKVVLLVVVSIFSGVVIGGYLFSDSQQRSVIALNRCDNCLSPSDLLGLMASVGIRKFPGLIPSVVFETDKTIVIKNPFQKGLVDYVIIPKKDIKNIGKLSREDDPYLIDAYEVARDMIEKKKLSDYRFYTNGPGFQDVTYLHFHLQAIEKSHNAVETIPNSHARGSRN
ncbi:MAG: HIT domain-containing protein [bacterium]